MRRFIFICIVLAGAFSCRSGKEKMGPEDVVSAFSRAVASGDFATAYELCDTVCMKDYLECFREAVNEIRDNDSTVFSIASGILSGAEIEVSGVEKAEGGRAVLYRIEACGHAKEKIAIVKKEEGEWKLISISDARQEEPERI